MTTVSQTLTVFARCGNSTFIWILSCKLQDAPTRSVLSLPLGSTQPEQPLQTSTRPCHPPALHPPVTPIAPRRKSALIHDLQGLCPPLHLFACPSSHPYTLLHLQWPSFCSSDTLICSCLLLFPWNAFPADVCMAGSFPPFNPALLI